MVALVASPVRTAAAGGAVGPGATAPPGDAPGPGRVSEPWHLSNAVQAPSWLRFGLEHRARLEHLQHDFRAASPGSWTGVALRTLARLELDLAPLELGVEVIDARLHAGPGTPLSTTLVDPLDLLQAFVRLRHRGLFSSGDALVVTAGRFTLDVGSRRVVARNDFRNTINSFTGLDVRWTGALGASVRAFAVLPVVRRPEGPRDLALHRVEADRENLDALLFGGHVGSAPVGPALRLEGWALGFLERDGPGVPTPDRRLCTLGVRVVRAPARARLDGQLELMAQLGASRATAGPTDVRDLDHLAAAAHAALGFTFPFPAAPRLAAVYDFASGDVDPADGMNNRFDPLFGARRFDLGPTGLYGALARSNLSAPGARLELAPHPRLDALVAWRAVWLATARDAWTTAGLRDTTASSGNFVGHQVEARVRWHALPGNLDLELGGAFLARGRFALEAGGARPEWPVYGYAQVIAAL